MIMNPAARSFLIALTASSSGWTSGSAERAPVSAAGVLVPLTLKRLRLDPALASGVFVTTCTDVLGFFFFLGFATLMVERLD